MIRFNILLFILIANLFLSCLVNKSSTIEKRKQEDLCVFQRTKGIGNLEDRKGDLIKKFNELDKGLQVLKINTSAGYDYQKNISLYFSDNESVFLMKEDRTYETDINFGDLLNTLDALNQGTVIVACENNGSLQIGTEFYVKYNGEIVSSLIITGISFEEIKNIDGLSQEYKNYSYWN